MHFNYSLEELASQYDGIMKGDLEPNHIDKHGNTILHNLIHFYGSTEKISMIRNVLEKKADPNIKDQDQLSPLFTLNFEPEDSAEILKLFLGKKKKKNQIFLFTEKLPKNFFFFFEQINSFFIFFFNVLIYCFLKIEE